VGDGDVSSKSKVLCEVGQTEGLTLCSTCIARPTAVWDDIVGVFTSSYKENLDEGEPEIIRRNFVSKVDRDSE